MSTAVPDTLTAVDANGLRKVRADLLGERKLKGHRFCKAYSDAVDEWLIETFARALAHAGKDDPTGVVLLAVGSYGRRELCPASDLDLILVHNRVRSIAEIADALWYPIWDAGLQVDHSVRTPRESAGVMDGDLKSALSFLSARPVAGDIALAKVVIEDARAKWSGRAKVSLERLRASLQERWEQHGELAFLLEPDLKLARGGLRDVEALRAATFAMPPLAEFSEDARLLKAADLILEARVGLHATTGRRSDQLLLDDQDAVARRLGYADADDLLPTISAAARRITWTADEVWRRIDAWARGPRRATRDRAVERGIALRGQELVLDGSVAPADDTSLALRIAAASARSGVSIATSTLETLEHDAIAPSEPWPVETRDALVDLLGCGRAAVPLLETLDHLGVLSRYISEWHAVRSKPQRNAFHRFTVDRHLFEAAAEAAELTRNVHRPDLLLVGALLHDVGKGFPGDHTEAGTRLMKDIARRMGFEAEDIVTLVSLVRDHLLLAETATGRDLGDPATVAKVAARVRTTEALDLLATLTRADSIATGPLAWNSWKETLIDELVIRTRAHLRGEQPPASILEPDAGQRRLMAEGKLRVVPEGTRLTIVAPDRAGLLAIVAGVLAVNRLPVRAATGLSENGMAVEVFDLDRSGTTEPNWPRLETELAHALEDPSILEARLAERARGWRLPKRAGAARIAPPRVLIDNDATPRATVVEVRMPDGVGVLAGIARAIAACGCDISVVRAMTLGHEVVDTFYVTDGATPAKVTDPVRVEDLQRTILKHISS
ncbi:MAG TPA: [protein-PII] uridylyltransferase [Actinomycetota bacterium]|nr:[protein-PII] uridylyltransferase [Actinomycetota bacterium]